MVQVCPQLQTNGTCVDPSCEYRHNVKLCETCGVLCSPAETYASHVKGKKHQSQVQGLTHIVLCTLCDVGIAQARWRSHLSTPQHCQTANRLGVSPDVQPADPSSSDKYRYCSICDRSIPNSAWAPHMRGRLHSKKERYVRYRAAFEDAEKNKNGVTISPDVVDFDIIEIPDAQRGVRSSITILTTVPLSKIQVVEVRLASAFTKTPSSFSVSVPALPASVIYGRDLRVSIQFQQEYVGRYEDRVEIILLDATLQQRFPIVRAVRAIVGSKADHELLKPRAPYVPRQRIERKPEEDVVPGVPPPASDAITWVVPLPFADIPKWMAALFKESATEEVTTRFRRTILPQQLNVTSYSRHWRTLLWIEEHQMERDLQTYDMFDEKLIRHGNYYWLGVPGLAENRPSVIIGDRILVQHQGSANGRWFEGYVHTIHQYEVVLQFDISFRPAPTDTFNVRFKLNRIGIRRQHQALATAFSPNRILFPLSSHATRIRPPISANLRNELYNRLLGTNLPQLQAIASIIQLKRGSPPFIVFGPPGTGKTVTIVEAIRQILARNPASRILACAPSNSAADLIASRLEMLGKDVLFRLYAPSRDKKLCPDSVKEFAYVNADGNFSIPPLFRLRRYKVIVSTCNLAAALYGIGMPQGHFSDIFIDEAGQATEPETMVSVKTLSNNDTNVILSGDPKQLGPIVRSVVARELGFETSFLERLMRSDVYDVTKMHGLTVVKLAKNFRSHPSILKFTNENFYKGDLQACGDPKTYNSFLSSPILVNPKFPIVVHAVSGKDVREASSPSFFNVDEVIQVKRYVEMLRSDRRFRISDADIGIIAPYHAQCGKLRAALRAVAEGVKIGSVEEFQGQERRVIIVSTVRSSREYIEYDLRHTLGFVANARRFNVSVTRAQALLIIVGDPSVLSLDPLWRRFLNYVHVNKGWRGNAPTWDTRTQVQDTIQYDEAARAAGEADMNDFTRRMEQLTLASVIGNAGEEDEADANVDRPWREAE